VGMLPSEGETEVPCLGSLGFLYEPLGPSLSFVSTHGFCVMNSTNISESVSSLHFTTKEHYTRGNYLFGSATYSPRLSRLTSIQNVDFLF